MSSPDLVELLRTTGTRDGRLVHLEQIPARPGRTAAWPEWADADVVAGYRRSGVEQPWTHQVQAADAAWHGRHTVIATGTGSGKSLAAWLPVLSAVRAGAAQAASPDGGSIGSYTRRPSTLYLSPTKALAADQLAGLHRLLAAARLRSVRVTTCDGDTPLTERDWARDHADVVLSNPDFLHFSMLPGHRRWQRLLRGLRYVVVDECHAYRGVLGAHVALVLRRLLRLAEHYGATPTVICASATTAEPALTASRLVGVPEEDVVAVTDDAAPAGRRSIALWQPALATGWARSWPGEGVDLTATGPDSEALEDGPRRSATSEAAALLADLVSAGARTLVFVRSRYGAEVIAEQTRRHLREVDGELAARVAAYRGGYLPEERRELERALRSGDLLALATTNALELGVDVAGLDAVIIAGWPGTRVSMWQQAGRAGRAGADGVAVLVASEDPLDGFLVHHPEAIFGSGVEATTFDPANPYVLAPHLCAAAGELPLTAPDLARFGLPDEALLAELARRGLLRRRPNGWFWNFARPERPQDLTDLRGGEARPVQVVEIGTGSVLGTVDGARADATVFPGAVYVHQGRTFVVDALEDEVALVHEDTELAHRTKARSTSSVRIMSTRSQEEWRAGAATVTWSFGDVEVTSHVTGYDKRRLPGMDIIGSYPLEMPERVLRTTAVWWTLSAEACEAAGVGKDALPGALHAAEHASIGLLPLLATCDRWDIGGLSTAVHPQTGQPTVFVHDGYPGGAGFAERGYRAAAQWLQATLDAITACACADGCPSCVQSPKCGNGNSPLDKQGAVKLLRLLLASAG
ncbi:DEAD/DEAH box helicase [Georgenia sp. SYP-B2076]|uniref:DEAD/DEAH box helicase n=1 Tax=Georgenia sp. SYP-B2076 TaxID=2495881 RepID=UPI000F8E904E|nr:DEAD/DEAH box helicase [Georgenia sp. SYP-B2076]